VIAASAAIQVGHDRLYQTLRTPALAINGAVSRYVFGGPMSLRFGSAIAIGNTGWVVIEEFDSMSVLRPLAITAAAFLLFGVAVVLAVVRLSRAKARALVGPIQNLLEVSRTQNPDVQLKTIQQNLRTGDEFEEIGQRVLGMTRELQGYAESLESKVAEKTAELERANRHKSEFLANMSHELRTPLNAVIGFSDVLKEQYFGPLNGKQTEYVTDINSSGQHLLSLINDILDLSKIEAGKMELDAAPFDMAAAVETALTLVRERAHRGGG
jgi:signal transduction histidine kinase